MFGYCFLFFYLYLAMFGELGFVREKFILASDHELVL
jgi:hypothetical protein